MTVLVDRPRSREWWVAASLVAGAAALLAAGFVIGLNPDEDELGTCVLVTILQVQAIARGALPIWSSRLAFGVPLPGSQSLLLHPLAPLVAAVDPRSAVIAIDLAHLAVGAVGFWWLCRTLKLSTQTTGVCAATFLLASPSLTYTLTDDWPTYFVAWTLAPVALTLVLRMLDATGSGLRDALALGTVGGVMLADGHLGHAPFLLTTLAAGALASPRRLRSRAPWFALAALVAVTIGADHLWTAADEYRRFPPALRRPGDATLAATHLWDAFMRPLMPAAPHFVFFGGPFTVLSVLALVRRDCSHSSRGFLALSAGVAGSLLVMSSVWRFPALSQTYLLQDAAVICGIALAGIALDRLRSTAWARYIPAIVTLQCLAVFGGAWPFVSGNVAAARAFRSRGQDARARTLAGGLLRLTRDAPGRIAFTPGATRLWYEGQVVERPVSWRTRLIQSGAMVVNGGAFKGIELEPFAPAYARPYGDLDDNASLVVSPASLTALGIRYVIAARDEPLAPDLERVPAIDPLPDSLELWRNPRAWHGARFMPASVFEQSLPLLPGCGHPRLFCRDLTPLVSQADPSGLTVIDGESEMRIDFPPADRPRALLVTRMYRDGWIASAGGRQVPLTPAFGALMRVDVPADVTAVALRYRPAGRVALFALSCTATLATVILLLATSLP
ncbi:MAG: hypothetical protein HY048_17555 [Acidobacteria bacterium]|nr:hypothetical protein [Acidobacteriota bacterium]